MRSFVVLVASGCALLIASAGSASAVGIDGTGSVPTCPSKGKISLKPGLVTGGALAGRIKVSVAGNGACSGGTGDGANIMSFKVRGAGTTTANSCASFAGTQSADLALTFRWKGAKGSPKLNPSTATFSLQPGSVVTNGNQTLDLAGTITAGSFVGTQITAHIESQDTAATLLALCDGKGIKKITFGLDDQTSSCMNGPNLHAAITQQITSIDSNDVPHLLVEILTVTASPFQVTETGLPTHPAGMVLQSLGTSCELSDGRYRCRHTADFESTGACRWDGDYALNLSYSCNPTNTCDLCSGDTTIPFSLTSENFCSAATVFCIPNLSCAQATAGSSAGGVPCCSSSYSPLMDCLATYCRTECASALAATGGIVPSSPCYTCTFSSCHDPYFACSADNEMCVAG